jgi:hypothetical protein
MAGGEIIHEVRVGGIGLGTAPYPDSSITTKSLVPLTKNWQMIEVPLGNADLHHIIGGFYIELSKSDNPKGATILIDRVRFVGPYFRSVPRF